jgi:hypothetical protein
MRLAAARLAAVKLAAARKASRDRLQINMSR